MEEKPGFWGLVAGSLTRYLVRSRSHLAALGVFCSQETKEKKDIVVEQLESEKDVQMMQEHLNVLSQTCCEEVSRKD